MSGRGLVGGDRILGTAADSHPDWCAAYGGLGTWRFVGASAIGKLHLRDARPRDDAFACRAAGKWLAVAVSDGVGSRPLSRYGAAYAVEALCEHLLRGVTGRLAAVENPEPAPNGPRPSPGDCDHGGRERADVPAMDGGEQRVPLLSDLPPLPDIPGHGTASGTLAWYAPRPPRSATPEEPWRQAPDLRSVVTAGFESTRAGLDQYARQRGMDPADLSCTLLGLLVDTEGGDLAAGQVGDGLIVAYGPGHPARPLVDAPTPPDAGETFVLAHGDWDRRLAVGAWRADEIRPASTFFVMTDGVSDACTNPPPADILQRWAADLDREVRATDPPARTAARLARWLATFEARGNGDDRTLVAVLGDNGTTDERVAATR